MLPAIAICLVFQYLPMFSNYIAFLDYDFNKGWFGFGSPFVGLKNFEFIATPAFIELLLRTLLYSATMLLFCFPTSLVLALLMNELRIDMFKKTVQTISYMPHFVSWVTVSGLVYMFLTTDTTGLVNNVLESVFHMERKIYMQDKGFFLPILIITQIWKETGWGTILYFAAIANIGPQLYEAADIDGATRLQKAVHITLPGLIPTTCILLIFSLGGLVSSNFDQIFNLQNPMLRPDTDTINIHVFYRGLKNHQYAYASAVGLFQGLVSFVLIMATNAITKRTSNIGII